MEVFADRLATSTGAQLFGMAIGLRPEYSAPFAGAARIRFVSSTHCEVEPAEGAIRFFNVYGPPEQLLAFRAKLAALAPTWNVDDSGIHSTLSREQKGLGMGLLFLFGFLVVVAAVVYFFGASR